MHNLSEGLKELQMEHESIANNRNRIKQKLTELRHEKVNIQNIYSKAKLTGKKREKKSLMNHFNYPLNIGR